MPISDRVWWWNLDREGKALDPSTLRARRADAPELKDGSIYTPGFLVNGELPPAHLHHRDIQISGIHGESDIYHLRLTLLLCLRHEETIMRELAPRHPIDIMLSDVLALLKRV